MSTTDYTPPETRERWGSRIGLILAMAGNAVGLGNFLRFPNEAVKAGSGFMVAYFICLLLLGIPLMWMEWTIGRRGGSFGYSTAPGMLQTLTRARWIRYVGAIGVFMPLMIVIYYVYIESWTLGYAVMSLTSDLGTASDPGTFFNHYLGADEMNFLGQDGWQGSWPAYGFFGVTIAVNLWVLSRGLSKGIELVAKIGMPILVLCAVALVARVLTLPDVDGRSVLDGLAIYWTPNWEALISPGATTIWLLAAGQIFFTLSVGSGAIDTYASYLRESDDIALTGLATVSTNEFCEVVLGGTLAIPAAYLFFGMQGVNEFSASNMGLAFVAMPQIFHNIPLFGMESGAGSVAVFGALWFGLLFVAGITSSLALSQPAMAFLQDAMGLTRRKAALMLGLVILLCVQPVILFNGVLDEIDYWAGTFGLVFFSTVEVILLMWVFGSNRAWAEIHNGAEIRIPRMFKVIMTYVTPVLLVVMLGWWAYDKALPVLFMEQQPSSADPYPEAIRGNAWVGRMLMLAIGAVFVLFVWVASRRGHYRRAEQALEGES